MALTHSEQRQISQRYAAAAFSVAQQAGEEQATLDALLGLKIALQNDAELASIIHNPLIAKEALLELFAALLSKMKAPSSAHKAVALMVQHGRASLLPIVAECFQAQLDAQQQVIRGELVSATALEPAAIEAIATNLSSKTQSVALSHRVDPSIIGGLRVHLGSRMLDASVAGQLSRLQRQLIQSASLEVAAT